MISINATRKHEKTVVSGPVMRNGLLVKPEGWEIEWVQVPHTTRFRVQGLLFRTMFTG